MINEKTIQLFITLVVFASISLYIILSTLGFLTLSVNSPNNALFHEISLIVKIISIAITFFIVLVTIKSKFLVKLFLSDRYIAGEYSGRSDKYNDENEIISTHNEFFNIRQSLLRTNIEGFSVDEDGNKHAHWSGHLVKIDNNKHSFLTEIETPHKIYLEIMQFSFHKDEVIGFITASSSNSSGRWRLDAKKTLNS